MIDYFTEEQQLEMGCLGWWWDGEYVTAAELTLDEISRYLTGGRLAGASRFRKRMEAKFAALTADDISSAALDIVERCDA